MASPAPLAALEPSQPYSARECISEVPTTWTPCHLATLPPLVTFIRHVALSEWTEKLFVSPCWCPHGRFWTTESAVAGRCVLWCLLLAMEGNGYGKGKPRAITEYGSKILIWSACGVQRSRLPEREWPSPHPYWYLYLYLYLTLWNTEYGVPYGVTPYLLCTLR